MPVTREVTRTRSAGYTPSGKQVYKVKTKVSAPEAEGAWTMAQTVYFFAGAIEVLLTFRFFLKALGANPESPFVAFTYAFSSIFESPFRGIFRSATAPGNVTTSVLEPSTLTAMVVYSIVAVGIVELIRILSNTNED